MSEELPGLIMCVCTGKCPGFTKMDIWDFINRVRVELPVEYGFIHPQLCEEDGNRFLADLLKSGRKMVVAGCAPNMQYNRKQISELMEGLHGRINHKKIIVPGQILDALDISGDGNWGRHRISCTRHC